MKRRIVYSCLALVALCGCGVWYGVRIYGKGSALAAGVTGKKTTDDRIREFGSVVHGRLGPEFQRLGIEYPPQRVTLVGLKTERMLEVWVAGRGDAWKLLKVYPILGASGRPGPKLRQGDLQVPEGLYKVELLNPNSLYHLALRVNYPNDEDRKRGREDGRTELGSDIMIHGSDCSVGCLAMGDQAAEDLFVLAAETGIENVSIILSPVDFRVRDLPPDMPPVPAWTTQLYASIRTELRKFKKSAVAEKIR